MHPSGNFLFAGNNVTSAIMVYSIDSSGSLSEINGSPFAVSNPPWSLAVQPAGNYLYAANQDTSNAVSGFAIASGGALSPLSNSPFSSTYEPISLTIDPTGSFVYTADFFSDAVSGLSLDAATGDLTELSASPYSAGSGTTQPASVAVDSTSKFAYVANFGTNDLALFSIDSSGTLVPQTSSAVATGTGPVAVVTVVGQP
jgi:6-phosphogluconolactonase (cycloisomerase 2 family)